MASIVDLFLYPFDPSDLFTINHNNNICIFDSRMSSVTFYKYCGNGFGEDRPLETGQRHAIVKVLTSLVSTSLVSSSFYSFRIWRRMSRATKLSDRRLRT